MLKMRLQLGFILLMTLLGLDLLWASSADIGGKVFFTVVIGILFLSALVLMLATLYKAREEEDGAICFAPDHPLVKASIISSGGQDKLCPVYWKLSGIGALATVVLAFCGLLLAALIAPFFGYWAGFVVLAVIGGFIVIAHLGTYPRWSWQHRLGRILFLSLIGGFAASILGLSYLDGELAALLLILLTGVLILAAFEGGLTLLSKFLEHNEGVVFDKIGAAGSAIGVSTLVQKVFKPTKERLCVKLRKCDLSPPATTGTGIEYEI